MKTLIINLILATFLIVGNIYPLIAQTPEQIYQKGLMKEEGEGALLDAIDFYNQVTDNSDADESLQAKALLRTGMCYEKLGKEEAVKAYQKLVSNFPGQKSEVAIAKERLSQLILAVEETAKTPLSPKFTKIKIPTKLSWSVKLSPDGKELVLVSDKKLWKMPLSGYLGSDIPGTPVQLKTGDIEVEWSGLDWSRDGKWIAFNEYPKHNEKGEYIENQSIFIVPSSGGEPKKLTENYRSQRVVNYRMSLSPDGKNLAFSSIEENKQHIFSTSVDNVILKQLTEMEAREPVFSPDGKYIAFVKDKNKGIGTGNLGLWVIEANGGKPYKLADAGKASSPIWSPDGKLIAFLDYSVGNQISIVPFSKTENTIGKVIRIDAPEGTEEVRLLAGWTPDNKIGALLVSMQEFGLYTLPVEGGQAAKILHDSYALQPRWSRNCEQIYYVATPEEGEKRSYRQFIASVSSSGGKGKPLQANINGKSIKQFGFQSGNRVSPDGKWIVTSTWTPGDTNTVNVHWPTSKIWKVSVDGEDATQITNTSGNFADHSPCWSPDGKKIAFVRFKLEKGKNDIFGGTPKIYRISSTGGEPELLVSISGKYVNSVIWSPDGRTIAYLTKEINQPHAKNLNLYDVEKKEIKIIEDLESANANNEMAWSTDSKRIAINDRDGKVIKIITLKDGSIEDISTGLVDVNIYHLDWSSDGERFVFGGWKGGGAEFWFMEDFLPPEKLAQKEEAKELEGIRIRQISKKPYLDDLGTVSSDGKYLSCVDWGKGDLAILNLSNGEKQLLMDNASLEEDPQKFVIGSAISKNGKQVAYSWWRPHHTFDLHIFDTEKNTSKLLFKEKGVEVYPLAWLSDEKLITIKQNRNEETTQITLFNVSDGIFQDLKSLDKRQWAQLCTSPDEEYIAYNTIGGGNSDINVLTADGKFELPLVVHPANDKVIGWIPGRKDFLFTSDRSGTWDLWTLPVMNGKPAGEAKRLFTEFGEVAPIGITEKGECFFGFSRRNFNAYITSVDKTTGKPDKKPREVLAGSVYSNSWSPNGEYMACIKQKKRSFELILQDINNGNERRLAKELAYVIGPYWSSDGNSVYIFGMDQEMRQTKGYKGAIYTVDVETGNIDENFQISEYKYTPSVDDALPISGHVVSADNKYIYLLFQNDWIVKRNLINGTDTILYRHPGFVRGVLQLSPGGKKLLFAVHDNAKKQSRLITISVNGGDERELCTSQEAKISESAFWSSNGKYVYFTERPEGTNLWRVNSEGGKPEKVWHTDKRAESFAMHPSGNEISYTVRERTTEIRVMEGLVRELEKIYSQNE